MSDMHRNSTKWSLEERHFAVAPDWYGGRQAWLSEKGGLGTYTANRACGLAALANVSLYLARTRPDCRALYPYDTADEENFTAVMKAIHAYVKPTPVGIFHLGMLSGGFLRYAQDAGVHLHANRADWRWNATNVSEYIKSGLLYGSPVLLLTWNTRIRELRNHWVTITGIEAQNGRIDIITSNWGYKKTYNLDEWMDAYSLYRGLNYFT